MKKAIMILLSLVMVLSLTACGDKNKTADMPSPTDTPTTATQTGAPQSEPTPEPTPIPTDEDTPVTEPEQEPEYDPMVERIDLTLDNGNVKYSRFEKANSGLTNEDNTFIFVFDFTNYQNKPSQFQDVFKITAFQNGTEVNSLNTWSSDGGDQYELINGFFKEVMKNGSITFGLPYILRDNSPVTIMVEAKSGSSDIYQIMEVYLDADNQSMELQQNTDTTKPANTVMTTDHMDIIAVCVDNSYLDKEGKPLKLAYLFYNFIATDENLKIDSKYTKLTFNGKNTYESDHYASVASAMEYMPNYYYSSYIKDVYLGTSQLVAATFYIPEGELEAGRNITISDSQIPGCDDVYFSTDDIRFFNDGESIAKAIDPDGYAEIMAAYEEADPEKTALVKELINGYYWWCYVNKTTYEVEFYSPDGFEVRTSVGITSRGYYSIRNGFIFCTYDNNGATLKIPYEIVNGEVEMDVSEAFDVMG